MLGAQYLRIVVSRWKLVTAIVVGCTLAAWLVTVLVLAQKPTFEASARLNIVPTSEELGYANRFVRGSTFDGGSTLLGTYAEFAHTRPVVEPIVDRWIREQAQAAGQTEAQWIAANTGGPSFSPGRILSILNYGEAPVVPLRRDIVDSLIEETVIESVEGTYLMQITVTWDDPKAAAWFANALADAIIDRATRMSTRTGTRIAGSLEARLTEKQAELEATLRRSREMKAQVGAVDIDRQKQSLLEAQIAEQSQLTSDRAQLSATQSQVAGLRSQTGGRMSTAQAAIEERLALEAPRTAGIARGIAVREGRVAQIRAQIAALGRSEDRIRQLDDRAQQLRAEVAALTERVSFSQTENLANAPRIQLIERASPPLTRSSPKTLFNTALGFVAGCALAGCALLVLGEAPPRRRMAEAEAEEPAAEAAPVAAAEPAPEAPALAPVSSAAPPPERRDPVGEPPAAARVFEMPRAAPGATAAFASLGALALARTAAPPEPEVRPEPEPEPEPEPQPGVRVAPALSLVGEPAADPVAVPEASRGASPAAIADPVFGFVLPAPRDGRRFDAAEVRGIGDQVAAWLGSALADERPITIAATGAAEDAQRLYQLLHDHRRAAGGGIATVDWSAGARALPRAAGKPMIYAGGGFGGGAILAHRDGAVLIAVREDDEEALAAEARRLAVFAGRPVHVVPVAG